MYIEIKQKLESFLDLLEQKRTEQKPEEQFCLKNTEKIIQTESIKLSSPDSNILGFPMQELIQHIESIENLPAEYERIFSQKESKLLKQEEIEAEVNKKEEEVNRIIYFANMISTKKSLKQKNIANTLSKLLESQEERSIKLADEGGILIEDVEHMIKKREAKKENRKEKGR